MNRLITHHFVKTHPVLKPSEPSMRKNQTKPKRNQKAYRKLREVRRKEMAAVADALAPQPSESVPATLPAIHGSNYDLNGEVGELVAGINDYLHRIADAQEVMRKQIGQLDSVKERLAALV